MDEPSFDVAITKLLCSPALKQFAEEANEEKEATANGGIAGVIVDDIVAVGVWTRDGDEVMYVGIIEAIVVDVEAAGDIMTPEFCGDANNCVAPDTEWCPTIAEWGLGHIEESPLLLVRTVFGVTSEEMPDKPDREPGCSTDNVESIALIESDCFPARIPDDGSEESGKFVNGTKGDWNSTENRKT